jgi:hypothetical protein
VVEHQTVEAVDSAESLGDLKGALAPNRTVARRRHELPIITVHRLGPAVAERVVEASPGEGEPSLAHEVASATPVASHAIEEIVALVGG